MGNDPNAVLLRDYITGTYRSSCGFPNTNVGWVQACRRLIHDYTEHSDGPNWAAYANVGDYAWVFQQIKKRVASDPTAVTPQLLCGNYVNVLNTLCFMAGIPMGQCRIISHTGDMQESGYQLFQDHVLCYIRENDAIQDADFGCDYVKPFGELATLPEMCWLAGQLETLIQPQNGALKGWGWLPGAASIRDRYWFATHDQSQNRLWINWNVFPTHENPNGLFVTASDLMCPQYIRDIIISTCAPAVAVQEIGVAPPRPVYC